MLPAIICRNVKLLLQAIGAVRGAIVLNGGAVDVDNRNRIREQRLAVVGVRPAQASNSRGARYNTENRHQAHRDEYLRDKRHNPSA